MEALPTGGEQPLEIPEVLPLLPIRDLVVFPYMVAPLMVSRELSAAAVDAALATKDRLVMLAAQRHEGEDDPADEAIHPTGTVGMVMRMRKLSDGRIKVLVQGLLRARVVGFRGRVPCFTVAVARLDEVPARAGAEVEALVRAIREDLEKYSQAGKLQSPEVMLVIAGIDDPGRLADLVAANLPMKVEMGQKLLEELDPLERLRQVGALLRTEVEILEVQATIQSRAKEQMSRTQREYFLREQLRQIQSELGRGGSGKSELEQLREQLDRARLPSEPRAEADRQLRRLEQTSPDAAEAGVLRSYLEWLAEIPWYQATEDHLDLADAQRILDQDHYGLGDVKDRILEHLGVLKLMRSRSGAAGGGAQGQILCFLGPPGVGKTSLGRSIARTLGRRFVRMSLGGIRDEAEIRGHRRTYVGALPGRVIQGMRQAGTVNPVFVLDEIDKLGADFRGDPAAALLEVLDPEQNGTFRDHYLGVAYDLSKVLFIGTANAFDPIPRALSDRMEVIRLSGYSEEEKCEITRRHVLPRQLAAAGFDAESLRITDPALKLIISSYTREAGLRDLERQIARIARKVARRHVEEQERGRSTRAVVVTPTSLPKWLGPPSAPHPGRQHAVDEVGAATGLAWTPYGGEVLEIEAQWMPGKGALILTGQLGDVMKESAMTALSFARARAASLGLKESFYGEREIHIHVPAGAVPKDGPSAGVTMACALVSLLTGQPIRRDVAMTGEITLRGRVLPVGGLKEKLLAAARAGIERVVVPADNAREVEELPPKQTRQLKVVLVRTMDDVLAAALRPAERREQPQGEQGSDGAGRLPAS